MRRGRGGQGGESLTGSQPHMAAGASGERFLSLNEEDFANLENKTSKNSKKAVNYTIRIFAKPMIFIGTGF